MDTRSGKVRDDLRAKEIQREVRQTEGTRLDDGNAGLLEKHEPVLTREHIVRGAFKMMKDTADRHAGRGRASEHIAMNGHFMWILQDHSHKRGGELLRFVKPGGTFLYEHVGKGVGPDTPTGVVFTNHKSKTNSDQKYLEHAFIWEAVDEYVINCGMLAFFCLLIINFELNDMKLISPACTNWQHLPLVAGEHTHGSLAHGKVMSDSSHNSLFNGIKDCLNLSCHAVKHIVRGGSTKRKAQEINDGGAQLKADIGWGVNDIGSQHYLQEVRSPHYIASSAYGNLDALARQHHDTAVNILRQSQVEFREDIIPAEGGLFPKLRMQVKELQDDVA
jgi:hypothetical protein